MIEDTLRNYRAIKAELEQLEEWIEEIEATLLYPKPQRLTGMPSAPTKDYDGAMVNLTTRHMELQRRYLVKQAELHQAILDAEDAIETLNPIDRRILRYKYFEGLTFEQIAVKMHYSRQGITKRHRQALDRLEARI